jgi:hypothetical protein
LLEQGVHPKVVSEMLGHASVAITLDIYSHVSPDLQRQAVTGLDTLFSEAALSPVVAELRARFPMEVDACP